MCVCICVIVCLLTAHAHAGALTWRALLPSVLLAKRSTYAGGASSGQCTAWYGRYRKSGFVAAFATSYSSTIFTARAVITRVEYVLFISSAWGEEIGERRVESREERRGQRRGEERKR